MKKYLMILFIAIFSAGCGGSGEKKQILAKINNYEITAEEFNEEFKDSKYADNDTEESRRQFLNTLINRKLILQDAQANNLDKNKDFLRIIEKFWEQSLFKLALDKESKEVSGSIVVDDKAIKGLYEKMLEEGSVDKPYDDMYDRIKWEFSNKKQSEAMNAWIDGLNKKAQIKINYNLLNQVDKEAKNE